MAYYAVTGGCDSLMPYMKKLLYQCTIWRPEAQHYSYLQLESLGIVNALTFNRYNYAYIMAL